MFCWLTGAWRWILSVVESTARGFHENIWKWVSVYCFFGSCILLYRWLVSPIWWRRLQSPISGTSRQNIQRCPAVLLPLWHISQLQLASAESFFLTLDLAPWSLCYTSQLFLQSNLSKVEKTSSTYLINGWLQAMSLQNTSTRKTKTKIKNILIDLDGESRLTYVFKNILSDPEKEKHCDSWSSFEDSVNSHFGPSFVVVGVGKKRNENFIN